MRLNLPILDNVSSCKNLLIAGMGGGFDVFCGLPIYFELRRRGQRVHLANYSFSFIEKLRGGTKLTGTLAGVTADMKNWLPYFPEQYLSQWFQEKLGEDVPIWAFQKTGGRLLLEDYQTLIDHLHIDGILLIDGGVDSLMRGDEPEPGTMVEDSISLAVIDVLKEIPVRLTACVGLGAEPEVGHAHVFENISALTREGGFLGSCSLVREMEVCQLYEDAVMYVQSQPYQESSVINSSIVSAVQGHYGNYHLTDKTRGSRLWISPLMAICWFFDARVVARRHLMLPELRLTDTFNDAIRVVFQGRRLAATRPASKIPLP